MSEQSNPAIPRTAWLALAVLLSGAFMALLDTTIVNLLALSALVIGVLLERQTATSANAAAATVSTRAPARKS